LKAKQGKKKDWEERKAGTRRMGHNALYIYIQTIPASGRNLHNPTATAIHHPFTNASEVTH